VALGDRNIQKSGNGAHGGRCPPPHLSMAQLVVAESSNPNTLQVESWHWPVVLAQLAQVEVALMKYWVLLHELLVSAVVL
jgi:hypothetical protein